jgi:NTE family protein
MAAAFAHDLEPQDIHERLHDMFVIRRALSKLTLPRYSLLDHRPFDAALRAHYGETAIEDLARPYFAVSTNLSIGREHLHRSGPLWQAVRASGAIPGLLPPFYTSDGDMLVDGCLIDNLPVRLMHRLKAGPNVAVALRVPGRRYFDVAYDDLPSGFGVAAGLVNAALGRATPGAPGIAEVLALSLTLSRDSQFPQAAGGEDVLFVPPVPAGMGIMEWSRHRELSRVAFDYASERIGQLAQSADIGFAQIWASRSA